MKCQKCDYENTYNETTICSYCGQILVPNKICSDVASFVTKYLNVDILGNSGDTWYQFSMPDEFISPDAKINRSFIYYLDKKFGYIISSVSQKSFFIRKKTKFEQIWKDIDEESLKDKCIRVGIKYEHL